MTPTPFLRRALCGALVLGSLGGCELLKHNEDAQAIINARVIGMPAGEFFDRYGRAVSRSEISGTTTAYDWVSKIPYALPGPDGLDERICRLYIETKEGGRISLVTIVYDAQGVKSTSRCGEIFAAKK